MTASISAGRRHAVRITIVLMLTAGLLTGSLASNAEADTWYTGPSARCTYTDDAPWQVGSSVLGTSSVDCKWNIKAIEHIVALKRYVGWTAETLDSDSYYCGPPWTCRRSSLGVNYDCYGDGTHTYFLDVEVRVHFFDGTRGEWARGYSPYMRFTC